MKSWTFFWKIFLLMARVCVVWSQMKNRMMVLGDTPPQLQPDIDDVFTSEDDVPLSNLASSSVGTPTFVEPKWKKNYRMEEQSEYTGGVSIPNYIIDLENVTPTQLFHLFWSEDLLEIISYQTNLYATQKRNTFYTYYVSRNKSISRSESGDGCQKYAKL
ncbi:hypothetical protein EVAR_88809_1 [Eumeta japonica]|uniref:PiggyBac transposable element-derived protein domain-containing protein n=1 Tax=Eumeta variegata TaxID=151549 RepID=A0A4C1YIV9_EUMVA|nr:hypothetical protein EVAR_88809_1 [Eumeta japonica]